MFKLEISQFLASQWSIVSKPLKAKSFTELTFWFLGAAIFIFPWCNASSYTNPLMIQFFNFSVLIWLVELILVYGALTKKIQIPQTRLFWAVGVLLLARTLSTLFSILPVRSIFGANMFMADGLLFSVEILVLGYFLLALKPSKQISRIFLWFLFLQSSLLSLQIVYEAIYLGGLTARARPFTPFTNPDYALSYFCIMIPIGIGLLVYSWRHKNIFVPTFTALGVFFSLVSAYYLLPYSLQLLHPQMTNTQPVGEFLQDAANVERFSQWKYGIEIGLDHPILGSGPGTTRALFYEKVADSKTWNDAIAMDLPHNDLIQQFSQTGIIGLLAYIGFWISLFWLWFKRLTKVEKADRPLFYGIIAGVITFLIFNQFLFTVLVVALVLVAVGVISLSLCDAVDYRPVKARKDQAVLIILSLVVGLGLPAGYYTGRYYLAELAYHQARLAETTGSFRTASKRSEEAVNWFPYDDNYILLESAHHALIAQRNNYDQALYERAIQEIKQTIQTNPYNQKAYFNQGIIKFLAAPDLSLQQVEAIDEIMAALKMQPYNSLWYEYATQAINVRTSAETVETFFARMLQQAPEELKPEVQKLQQRFAKKK